MSERPQRTVSYVRTASEVLTNPELGSSTGIPEYQVNGLAPTEKYMKNILSHLLALAVVKPDRFAPQAAVRTKMGALAEIRTGRH